MPTLPLSPQDQSVLRAQGFRIEGLIKAGGYGAVFKATYNSLPVAVKCMKIASSPKDYIQHHLTKELRAMQRMSHKNLIDIYDIHLAGNSILVFMELASGGDLSNLSNKIGPMNEGQARFYYRQVGAGLRYIHSIGYAHRDIKCENVLLDKDLSVCKLTDFSFTRKVTDPDGRIVLSEDPVGTAEYAAPEVVLGQPYDAMAADIYSLGILLAVLLQNSVPFHGCTSNPAELLAQKQAGSIKLAAAVSDQCKNFIN